MPFCCSAEAVQTSHCILDRLFFFHKIIVPTFFSSFCVVNFISEDFAGVQNNEYHRMRFYCTEVDTGVIIQQPSRGSCVRSESVHIQYVVSLKYRNE